MKQKDITLIAVVVFISAVISYAISKTLITTPKNRKAQIEIVEAISGEFSTPSTKYFNSNAVDPTALIQIGDNPNPSPFQ